MTILKIDKKLYEINDTLVDVYDISTGQLISQQNNFNDIFKLTETSIDAAINWGDGKIYFFKNDNYFRFDISSNNCDEGYPLTISGNWSGLWTENIWTGMRRHEKAYFFAGEEYIRFDCVADKSDEGYPLKIADQWHGLPQSITGIVMLDDNFALVQNDTDYYLYDWNADLVVNNTCDSLTEILKLYLSSSPATPSQTNPTNSTNTQPGNQPKAATVDVISDWQTILSNINSTEDEIRDCSSGIRQLRDTIPVHVKPTSGGYYYYGKSNSKPSGIATDSVEDWIWQEIKSEGSFDSINAYDNMIFTWGKGIAKSNILKILTPLFAADANLKNTFYNVGIAVSTDGVLQVVNTSTNKIITGNDALQLMKTDTKLLDFFADIAQNPSYQTEIATAQWAYVMNVNSGMIQFTKANNWNKDAVQLCFHFNWWLPGYGWNGNAQAYKDTGGDSTKIIITFKQKQLLYKNDLIAKLKLFAGNAFAKYIALANYTTPLDDGSCEKFIDGNTTYYVPVN